VIAELREKVQRLQEENELLEDGRNSRTNSTAPFHDIYYTRHGFVYRIEKGSYYSHTFRNIICNYSGSSKKTLVQRS
jgi:hypothetical protein